MARGGRPALVVAAVLVAGAGVAGCSDDSGGTGEPKRTPPAVSSDESTPADSGSPAGEPSGGAAAGAKPSDPAAAEKQIRTNWRKFFDPATGIKEKPDYLEDGAELKPLMTAFSSDKRMKQVRAKVSKVTFTSAQKATVTYSLTLNGATAVPGASGSAVLQDHVWKVSKSTLCGLIGLSGSPAPGCS